MTVDCREAYEAFEFRRVFNAINQFCTHELSALYIDITKDRLYCDPVASPRRRSTQTAMHRVFETLCRLLAPILAYTADEAWEHSGHADSVHLEDFPLPDADFAVATATPVVGKLLGLREELAKELEKARAAKVIGKSVEAEVTAHWPAAMAGETGATLDDIAEIFILSRLTVEAAPADAAPTFTAIKSPHARCGRCWRHLPEVGSVAAHPELCPRCAQAVAERE